MKMKNVAIFFKTVTPHGLNDMENIPKKYNYRPIKLPYGSSGLENLEFFMDQRFIKISPEFYTIINSSRCFLLTLYP